MKKWIFVYALLGVMPLSLTAQDDMYFVPSKKLASEASSVRQTPRQTGTYYSGSNRDVDEYNRRGSSYEVLPADTASDIIMFSAEQGVYPDSAADFNLTRQMARYDGYEPSETYWAGYNDGRRDSWGWHSPWYYSSWYPWYDGWYDPWYYGYYGYRGWYDPWYYGYYDPWYYGGYGWYGWHRPYYAHTFYVGGGRGGYYGGHTGTISMRNSSVGRSGARYGTGRGSSIQSSGSRVSSARQRTVAGHSSYGSNTSFGSSRSSSVGSSATRSSSSSYGGGSFGGSSRSSGSFSGGGSRGGSIRSGGRR